MKWFAIMFLFHLCVCPWLCVTVLYRLLIAQGLWSILAVILEYCPGALDCVWHKTISELSPARTTSTVEHIHMEHYIFLLRMKDNYADQLLTKKIAVRYCAEIYSALNHGPFTFTPGLRPLCTTLTMILSTSWRYLVCRCRLPPLDLKLTVILFFSESCIIKHKISSSKIVLGPSIIFTHFTAQLIFWVQQYTKHIMDAMTKSW